MMKMMGKEPHFGARRASSVIGGALDPPDAGACLGQAIKSQPSSKVLALLLPFFPLLLPGGAACSALEPRFSPQHLLLANSIALVQLF